MQTMIRRRREATPERWQKALERAFANGCQIFQDQTTGMWIVTSASKPGACYATDGEECSCEAWLAGDPVCQHRALYRWRHGRLEGPRPQATATAHVNASDLTKQLTSAIALLREVRSVASLDAVEYDQLSAAIRRIAKVADALSATATGQAA